jgi:hypothetical protein
MSTFVDSPLKIELIGTGEQVGTWGATTNVNLQALQEAITGSADVAFSSADVTLTLTNTNGTQTARNLRLVCTGTSGGARNLILGSGCQIDRLYLVQNDLADAVTVKNTTGTGVAVPAGKSKFVFNDGTNVVEAVTAPTNLTTGVTGTLAVGNGGTGATTLTGVLKGNGTSAFTASNVNLASEVTGTLPIANGGTGATVAATALSNLGGVTQAGARSALSFVAGSGAYNASTGVITIPTNNNQIANGSGFTTNTGTVTSVSGTGTASGLTLSGTVTTSGNLTLSGTVNSLAAGTYNISISGNAATATNATNATNAATVTDPFPTRAKALITTVTISASTASIDFTGLAAWDAIDVVYVDLNSSLTSGVTIRISTNNGATYLDTGYATQVFDQTSATNSTTGLIVVRGDTGLMRGVTQLKNMSVQTVMSSNVYIGPSSSGRTGCSAGIAPAGSVNAIRLFTASANNFTSGVIHLFGVIKK